MNKIVAFYGSARKNGNTATIVNEILKGSANSTADIKSYHLSEMDIKPCRGCFYCRKNECCTIKDDMQDVLQEIKTADAIIISSPIYMFQVSGQVKQMIDRLYPVLIGEPGRYSLSYELKKTITVYSQGLPNIDAYKEYITHNNKSLHMLGLNVVDTILCCSGNNPKAASENEELLKKAYRIGTTLISN